MEDLFSQAAHVLAEALSADACMVIFRRDCSTDELTVVAHTGLAGSIASMEYVVGIGLTGMCALQRVTVRRDDAR